MCMRGGGTRSMCTKRSYRARISQYLPSSSCHDHDHDHQSDFKRSKKMPISSSKFTSIDDLPDHILVEILCRLPQKSTSQYKCVSKNWYLLISDPYFFRRFLCIQHERQNPIKHTLIFSDDTDPKTDIFSIEEQLGLHSKHRRKFSFSFLPCYGATGREPLVVGTYKDLVCCCATWYNQRDYYICNPYTKQWVALPPTPRCHKVVRAGFICNPKHQNDDDDIDIGDRKQESYRYRYKIVQIIIPVFNYATPNSFQFNLQMFCSESGKWTEAVALSPQSFCLNGLSADAGVAHNGMLYWRGHDFIFGLDPFSNDNPNTSSSMITDDTVDHHTFHCRFIGKPDEEWRAHFDFLGVCRGRLRMCLLFPYTTPDGGRHDGVSIWELKDDDLDHEAEANNKWCLVHIVYTDQIVSETPLMSRYKNVGRWEKTIMVQDFDPNNEDVLYLQLCNRQVMYDLRTRTLEVVMLWPYSAIVCPGKRVFTFVIPWWPTLQHQYAYASPS